MNSLHLSKKNLCKGKFLELNLITYQNEDGKQNLWETCDRTTRNGSIDGVDIIATLKEKNEKDKLILIIQYRPPTERYVLEFPAGLIDKNETIEECAIRELKEETGYLGKVTRVSPILVYEPGMTSANTKVIEIECLKEENEKIEQKLDETEHIQVILIEKENLYDKILELSKENILIDSKVYTFVLGK